MIARFIAFHRVGAMHLIKAARVPGSTANKERAPSNQNGTKKLGHAPRLKAPEDTAGEKGSIATENNVCRTLDFRHHGPPRFSPVSASFTRPNLNYCTLILLSSLRGFIQKWAIDFYASLRLYKYM